jgi:uncharacterized membrane protein
MKRGSFILPWCILGLLWLALAGYVWFTLPQLPEHVATHFGASGEPNGWMTRVGHVQFTLVMSAVVTLFVLGIFAIVRHCQGWGLNIPHKDYWLAPERREETFDFIQRQGLWFAGLFIVFLAGIHHSILAANARTPVRLPTSEVTWIAGSFIVASVVWVVVFIVRFSRKPA